MYNRNCKQEPGIRPSISKKPNEFITEYIMAFRFLY